MRMGRSRLVLDVLGVARLRLSLAMVTQMRRAEAGHFKRHMSLSSRRAAKPGRATRLAASIR